MQSPYRIPELSRPQPGLTTPAGGNLFYGDFSDGFNFPRNKVKPHRHPYFEVFWFPRSSGGFLADFQHYSVSGPSLVFVSPGQVHGWPDGHRLKGHMLAFNEALFTRSMPEDDDLLRAPIFYDPWAPPVIKITEGRDKLDLLWSQLAEEYREERPDKLTALRSLLNLLLIESHRVSAKQTEASSSASVRAYQNFVRLLHQDVAERRFPKHFAQALNISTDYLSSCIKDCCGYSTSKLISDRVILEAKRLLVHSNLTISEIAFHLHFKDPSYFTRVFKKQTGLQPKTFRQQKQVE